MILNAAQIEEIKTLILKKQENLAVEKLVEYSGCNKIDAQYVVEEFNGDNDFEELLDKHWIESRDDIDVSSLEEVELSKKEKLSLVKIFSPVILVIILAIILMLLN